MKTSITDAMSQLRSANPVSDSDYRGAHTSAYAQGLLEQITGTSSEAAAVVLPGAQPSGYRATGGRMRGNRVLGTMVAAVAVLIAVAVGGVLVVRSLSASGANPVPPAVSAPPSVGVPYLNATKDPNYVATAAALDRILATTPVPADSTRLDHSPNVGLTDPDPGSQAGLHITRDDWWTVPGAPAEVVQFALSHVPQGLKLANESLQRGNGVIIGGDISLRTVGCSACHPFYLSPFAAKGATLEITVQAFGSGSALRAEATSPWTPTRTSLEFMPPTLETVSASVANADEKQGSVRDITGAGIERIAKIFNALPTDPQDSHACKTDKDLYASAMIDYRFDGHNVTISAGPCRSTFVRTDNDEGVFLALSLALYKSVLADLGLPPYK